MCASPEQLRKKDEAKRDAMTNTMGVNATGEKSSLKEYDDFSNQINDE